MTQVLNIGVIGSTGKMGQRVERLLRADDQTVFSGGICSKSSVENIDKLCETIMHLNLRYQHVLSIVLRL